MIIATYMDMSLLGPTMHAINDDTTLNGSYLLTRPQLKQASSYLAKCFK